MMCSMLSREKAHPALLITSAGGTPEWVSSFEALKLAVGMCDFTCCQRNHTFPGIGVVPCDRDITREILVTLIESKIKYLFDTMNDTTNARLYSCLSTWWTRTLDERLPFSKGVKDLKNLLRWHDDEVGLCDSNDISILLYVSVSHFVTNNTRTFTHVRQHQQQLCDYGKRSRGHKRNHRTKYS